MAGLLPNVLSLHSMNTQNQANFNNLTVTGRINHIERVTKNGDTWLAVTVISNLQKDDEGTAFTFNTTRLDGLFDGGYLPVGRVVTIVGRIKEVKETYFDKKSGTRKMYKRPMVAMEGVSIPTGGLGALPKSRNGNTDVVVDEAPQVEPAAPAAAPAFGSAPVSF